MNEYDFTFTFDIRNLDLNSEDCADLLYANGCDDALIGIGQEGYIALNFIREADTAENAVISALEDVRRTLPQAPLIEAAPDLGGISDIADLLKVSRQHARRLTVSDSTCPPPIHAGKSYLWHMSDIFTHLHANHSCRGVTPALISLTQANREINTLMELKRYQGDFLPNNRKDGHASKLEKLLLV